MAPAALINVKQIHWMQKECRKSQRHVAFVIEYFAIHGATSNYGSPRLKISGKTDVIRRLQRDADAGRRGKREPAERMPLEQRPKPKLLLSEPHQNRTRNSSHG